LTYRNQKAKDTIQEKLQAYSHAYQLAVLRFDQLSSLREMIDQLESPPDYLVDFAQSNYERLIAFGEQEQSYSYFEENVAFRSLLVKEVSRLMLGQRRGRLIFISSSAAAKANPGQGFYAAAKLACEALYRNLGLEMGRKGITTLSLRLGYVNSGRGKKYLDQPGNQALQRVPLGRPLQATEIAESILFFLSDSAVGLNATEVVMDGGLTSGK